MSLPRARSLVFLLGVGVFLALSVCTAPAVATDTADEHDAWALHDNTSMVVDLQADGDAIWQITTVVELRDENDTEAFQELAASFESGDQPQLGLDAFEVAVQRVDQGTDREMELTDVERTSAVDTENASGTGSLTLEFTWENFARTEENQLFIDDVLVTSSGDVWFEGLNEQQSLTIAAPPAYGVRDANVGAEDGELRWEGPREFDETSLQANFIGPGGTDPNGNGSGSGIGSTDPDPGIAGWGLLRLGLLSLAVVVVLVALYAARVSTLSIEIPAVRPRTSEAEQSAASEETDAPESTAAEAPDTGDPESGSAPVATVDGAPEEDRIDEALLSDEERVERLLSANGGRMKQADIVKETDWSNAKVSQLLSSMDEDGQIDKLRIGRENLISFPDEDVADIDE